MRDRSTFIYDEILTQMVDDLMVLPTIPSGYRCVEFVSEPYERHIACFDSVH